MSSPSLDFKSSISVSTDTVRPSSFEVIAYVAVKPFQVSQVVAEFRLRPADYQVERSLPFRSRGRIRSGLQCLGVSTPVSGIPQGCCILSTSKGLLLRRRYQQ